MTNDEMYGEKLKVSLKKTEFDEWNLIPVANDLYSAVSI